MLNAKLILFVLTIIGSLFTNACSDSVFTARGTNKFTYVKDAPDQKAPSEDATKDDEDQPQDDVTFGLYKPALAVRSSACLACHAKIVGDFVTDLMAGTPSFMPPAPQGDLGAVATLYGGKNSLRFDSWQSVSIDGKLLVPKVEISNSRLNKLIMDAGGTVVGDKLTLKQALTTEVKIDADYASVVSGLNTLQKPVTIVDPARDRSLPGINEIREVEKVVISPPQEAEILALADKFKLKEAASQGNAAVFYKDKKPKGFKMIVGRNEPFVYGTGSIDCEGDVVIKGTLVLHDAHLAPKLCRIYVSGSIFISDALEGQKNLQLASGRSIFMGISSLKERSQDAAIVLENANVMDYLHDAGPVWVMYAGRDFANPQTDATNAVKVVAYSFYSHQPTIDQVTDPRFKWIPVPGQSMPSVPKCAQSHAEFDQGGFNCIHHRATSYKRKTVDYKNLFLTAPEIHSRYFGKLQGSAVANFALFALTKFEFSYDETLNKLSILPLLKRQVVEIK